MRDFEQGYGVIVVGAAAGIGASIARLLAARGASVMVADRDMSGAETVAAEIVASGGRALPSRVDVTEPSTAADALAQMLAWNVRLHGVVNSAGIQGPLGRPSHEVDLDQFEATLRVNLTGGLVIAREFVPEMLRHSYGRVVHLASIAGKEGNPHMVAYSASKAGLIGMVKAQGKEYAQSGVLVNAIAPAVIRTPFLDSQPTEVVDYMVEKIPMGRLGDPSEVAELACFAVSPSCSFTTGFVFDASGGRATY